MNIITSKDNEFVKHVKKLKEKKYRDICQSYIIEGIKLINEAINENANIKQIVICEDCTKIDVIPKELMYEIAKYECNLGTILRTVDSVRIKPNFGVKRHSRCI